MSIDSLEIGVLISHFDRFREASRIRNALEPYAESPGSITDRHPCHVNLIPKEKCGRCSRAVRAWTVMEEQQSIVDLYIDREWVLFSKFEHENTESGFWCNEDGWTGYEGAEVFVGSEILTLTMPVGHDVIWLPKDIAEPIFNPAKPATKP